MPNLVLITKVASEHGLTADHTNRLFRELGLPVERTRSPASTVLCNAITPDGVTAFEKARSDAGFFKLNREAVA